MNTEFFRARLEEVRSNLELTRADKRKTLENLLERNLTQELKEVLKNNLSLLLQAEEKIPRIGKTIRDTHKMWKTLNKRINLLRICIPVRPVPKQ